MVKAIVLIMLFVIFVYVYSSRKIKKSRERTGQIDSIRDFHDTYDHLLGKQPKRRPGSADDYQKYVTKYNSSEDYREKL
ncbi:MAG: hypothetical protein NC314_10865 [Roseburia sp.]|nr:hypothetical protein [Ruminococcus sp.]MCM1154549.1 hypothetical protein [Roseburia sp.]MCM1243334.1 hypothetical protein [Roseburia sp.]